MKVDIRPAEELFITLHAATQYVCDPNSDLREIAAANQDQPLSFSLFKCFNPSKCWYCDLEATLDFFWDKSRKRPRVFFAIKSEGQASTIHRISLDISDPQHSISDHWESLIGQLAMYDPETLKRIAESGGYIDECRNNHVPVDRVQALHKFCDYQKNVYINLTSQFVDLEELDHDYSI